MKGWSSVGKRYTMQRLLEHGGLHAPHSTRAQVFVNPQRKRAKGKKHSGPSITAQQMSRRMFGRKAVGKPSLPPMPKYGRIDFGDLSGGGAGAGAGAKPKKNKKEKVLDWTHL